MTAPMPPVGGDPPAPAQPPGPPPKQPWTPFQPRPNDTEPRIAKMWMDRLSRVMSTVKFSKMPVEWQDCLVEKYTAAREIVAQSMQPAPEPRKPQQGGPPQ